MHFTGTRQKTNVTNECSGRYSDKIKAQPWRSCTSCISLRCPWFFAHWIRLKHSWKHERSWRQCGYSGHLGHQHISISCPWVVQAKTKTKSNNSIKDYQQLTILILHSCAIFSWQMPSNTVFWFAMFIDVYCHSFTSSKHFPISPPTCLQRRWWHFACHEGAPRDLVVFGITSFEPKPISKVGKETHHAMMQRKPSDANHLSG